MKKIFTFFLTALFAFITTQSFAQSQRILMVEEGTQASCPPCASLNPAFDALMDANAENVVVLKYQTSWPGFDPMYNHNPSEVDERVAYYDITGVPSAYLNGSVVSSCGTSPACFSQVDIDAALMETSPLDINLSLMIENDMLTLTGKVEATEAVSGDLKLRMAIIEKNIDFDNPPGTTNEKEFHNVLKKFITGTAGTDLADSWAAGDSYDIDESFDLSTLNVYNPNQIMVVAFVQDDATKAIHQAAKAADPLYTNSASVIEVQDPGPACLGLQDISPVVRISNDGGETLTSLDITYSINGGADKVYNWTGSIAPLERQILVLEPYSFESIAGDNSLTVSTSNPNGMTDDNEDSSKDYIIEVGNEIQTDKVSIRIYADDYGCEIYWEFRDVSNGQVLASGGNDTAMPGGQTITYGASYSCPPGVGYENNTTHTEEVTLPATGCYEFYIIDDWGDGISGSAYVIRADNNFPLVTGSGFSGAQASHRINVVTSVGVEDVVQEQSFNAFPNPAQNELNLQFNLLESSEIQVLVYDVLGQAVKSIPAANYGTGINNLQINTADLSNGVYVVTLRTDEGDLSKRVTVSK